MDGGRSGDSKEPEEPEDMTLTVGDVVTAHFPTHDPAGHEQEGYRPAVVVGLPARLGRPRFPLVILVPLTTDRGGQWTRDSPLLYPRLQRGSANLDSASVCLLDQVRAVGPRRLRRYRGSLAKSEYEPIREGLVRMMEVEADERDD